VRWQARAWLTSATQSVKAVAVRGSPLGLVVQARRGVQVHHLVILHGEVLPRPLQMRHLHIAITERGKGAHVRRVVAGLRLSTWLCKSCLDRLTQRQMPRIYAVACINRMCDRGWHTCMKYPATMALRMLA